MIRFTLLLLSLSIIVGCGGTRLPSPETEPLTLEKWTVLPATTKYEVETLERLKEGTPKLQDDREWAKFTRAVLIPAKKKETSAK